MAEIAPYRLNLLRAGYLLLAVGMGTTIWQAILDPAKSWTPDRAVVVAMLGSMSLLAVVGLRHPLRMLPLLFWEFTWKAIWLCKIAFPSWRDDRLDAATAQTAIECLAVVVVVAVVPWDHVLRTYVTGPGERWRRNPGQAGPAVSR